MEPAGIATHTPADAMAADRGVEKEKDLTGAGQVLDFMVGGTGIEPVTPAV